MKTIMIRDKEYVPVVERVKEFHRLHPKGEIRTEIIRDGSENPTRIIVMATVFIPEKLNKDAVLMSYEDNFKTRIFTGHSQAEYGKGMMGGVALEVAETSAIGRALGFANIGLLDSIASADELKKNKVKGDPIDDSQPPF